MKYLLRKEHNKYICYDNEKDKVCAIKATVGKDKLEDCRDKGIKYHRDYFYYLFAKAHDMRYVNPYKPDIKRNWMRYTLSHIPVGSNMADIKAMYDNSKERLELAKKERIEKEQNSQIYRDDGTRIDYILKDHHPSILRETDTRNRRSFDFIRVEYNLKSKMTISQQELMTALRKDMPYIVKHTTKKIADYSAFQSYGVPVNILKVTRCVVTNDRILQLTFEPKLRDLEQSRPDENEERAAVLSAVHFQCIANSQSESIAKEEADMDEIER